MTEADTNPAPLLSRVAEEITQANIWLLLKLRLQVEDPPQRKHMVYLGGAVLAGIMKDAPEIWISREDYPEDGIACLSKYGRA